MIDIGKHVELEILRETSVGLFLGDEDGDDILLPFKYYPEKFEIGDKIEVFVYRDYAERKIATTLRPKILLNQFALLEVADVSDIGAFLDWGLEKHLMVPFREQRQKMEVGRWYVVYMNLDEETDRLYATNKIEKYLNNDQLSVNEDDEVQLIVYKETELGYAVIINHQHRGLIFRNEVFRKLNIGDELKGYIKKIRAENKIDVALQPQGYKNFIDPNSEIIYKALKDHNGALNITDKSSPEAIYARFGMSKKAFKKAIGALYKARKIIIGKNDIRMVE